MKELINIGKCLSMAAGLCLLALSMPAAMAGGDESADKVVNKTRQNGVTVWRPTARPVADRGAKRLPELAGPELAGAEPVIEQDVEVIIIRDDRNFAADFAVGQLRVSGFYSGYGKSVKYVHGFYSGKRRARPSTVQGFYSGYKRNRKNRFPLERPNGRLTSPLPPGAYVY